VENVAQGIGVSFWHESLATPSGQRQEAGVWERLHAVPLAQLRLAERIDWSHSLFDSASIRAVGADQKQDQTPPTALVQAQSTISSPKPWAFRSRPS
jgi:hypothetical protein